MEVLKLDSLKQDNYNLLSRAANVVGESVQIESSSD